MKELQLDAKKAFAINLKRLRAEKSMTQVELSKKSGITQASLSSLENGLYWPDYNTVAALAKALKCDQIDLFKDLK